MCACARARARVCVCVCVCVCICLLHGSLLCNTFFMDTNLSFTFFLFAIFYIFLFISEFLMGWTNITLIFPTTHASSSLSCVYIEPPRYCSSFISCLLMTLFTTTYQKFCSYPEYSILFTKYDTLFATSSHGINNNNNSFISR